MLERLRGAQADELNDFMRSIVAQQKVDPLEGLSGKQRKEFTALSAAVESQQVDPRSAIGQAFSRAMQASGEQAGAS